MNLCRARSTSEAHKPNGKGTNEVISLGRVSKQSLESLRFISKAYKPLGNGRSCSNLML